MTTEWAPTPPPQLRDDAEAELARIAPAAEVQASPPGVLQHELQVQHIELEMQNESLRQAQIVLEESRDRYVDLFEFAPVSYLTLSRDGQITSINLTGATLLGEERRKLLQRRFSTFVVSEEQDGWHRHFMTAFQHGGKQTCELRIQRSDGAVFTVCLDSLLVESVNTEPTLRITLTDITERRQALAQQYAANERLQRFSAEQAMHLRELASELTHAEQRERDLLYEQLHDEVQPLLVAARLSLSSLSVRTPPEDRLYIASEACVHISKVLQVTRSLSLQLSPPLIRERGLNPALEFLCRWVKSYHGLEVELTGAPEAEPGEVALRLVCFSAVRELLMNVAKHAGTAHATLTLQLVDQDTLHITVTDRGNGFDPAIITNGSGLSGLERRLGMFGGGLQIDSKPGHGTVATLSVPLRETTPAGWMLRSPEPRRKTREYDAQDTDC